MRRRMCFLVIAATGLLALAPPGASAAPRPFEQRFSTNDTGDITIAANTLMTCMTTEGQCAGAQAGTATGAALNNNAYVMQYVNTDTANAPVPVFNSSTADLVLPPGATVLKAMLYFGADSNAGAAGAPPPNAAARNTVLFKAPGRSYLTKTAAPLDFITTDGNDFQGVVDVTADVSGAGAGTYSVANVQAGTGRDRHAGWSLVVAYRDTSQPPRNLTIFDGFQIVNSGNANVSIPVSGFQTPPTGPVRTRLGLVGYEGDAGSTGDVVKLNTTNISDATNPATNVFGSSIAIDGARVTTKDPDFVNQLGFDANLIRADGILANGATNAVIRLTTGGETYFPGAVTFATELFAPALELTKSVEDVNGGQVEPGDELRYTLTAANTGGDDATNVVITDPIPTHTSFLPGSLEINGAANPPESSFDAQNNEVKFNVGTGASPTKGGTLPAGTGTATVRFSLTVDEPPTPIPPGTQIANAGRADFFAETLGVPLSQDSNEVTTTVAAPDLTIAKTPTDFVAVAGGTQNFALTVTNSGTAPTDGSQVTVTDTPPALAFSGIVSASGAGWDCTIGATSITCTRIVPSALAPGDSYAPIDISLSVVAAPPVGNVTNTASVAGGGDGDTTNNSSTAIGQATTRADLQILKMAEPATALTGEQVTFTLRVRNGGPSAATAVQVTDNALPSNYDVVSATPSQGSCPSTSPVQCNLGDMADGDEATVTVVATVTATDPGVVSAVNTASVTSSTEDPDPSNDTSTTSVDVPPTADVSITKAASPDPLDTTAPASYTLTAHNDGPQTAVDVAITAPLPPEFTPTGLPAGCAHTPADNTVVCDLGDIPDGGDAAVTITGTLAPSAAATFLSNSAVVDSATGDPDRRNNSTTNTTLVIPAADLELTKFADNTTPEAGANVTFTLQLTNHGPSVATNAQVVDTLPGGMTFVSAPPGCTAAGNTVTCAAGSLAAGVSVSLPIVARVEAGAAGSDLTNIAAATSETPDPIDANNSDATTVTAGSPMAPPPPPTPPAASADLVLSKRALDAARVGRSLRYAIAVENRGPSTANAVTVSDALAGQLAFVSATATQGSCSGTRTVSCALGDLPSGSTATVTLTVTPRRTGSVANTATATSSTPDPDAGNNVAAATVRSEFARTRVSVRKRADRRTVASAGVVDYRIVVRNTGDAGARDLRVCDRLGAGLAFVTTPGARLRNGQACWTIRRLARGKSRTFRVTARASSTESPRRVTNRARVTGANVAARAAQARVRVLPAQAPTGGVTG
jgi:uncharacterized repeat protein (TIGR01451 family)